MLDHMAERSRAMKVIQEFHFEGPRFSGMVMFVTILHMINGVRRDKGVDLAAMPLEEAARWLCNEFPFTIGAGGVTYTVGDDDD